MYVFNRLKSISCHLKQLCTWVFLVRRILAGDDEWNVCVEKCHGKTWYSCPVEEENSTVISELTRKIWVSIGIGCRDRKYARVPGDGQAARNMWSQIQVIDEW